MTFELDPVIANLNPRVIKIEGKDSKGPRRPKWTETKERAEDWLRDNGGDHKFEEYDTHRYGIVLDADTLVVDVDVHDADKNGYAALNEIIEEGGPDLYDDAQLIVESPSGGAHLFFKKDPNVKYPKSVSFFKGLDFLSKGSQVIGAGSTHVNGGQYKVVKWTGELSQVNPCLIQLLTPKAEVTQEFMVRNNLYKADSPVDDFNTSRQGVHEVKKEMEKRGYVFTQNGDYYNFVRPGKTDFSHAISGTLGRINEQGNYYLKCFSTSDAYFSTDGSVNACEALRILLGCAREDMPILLRNKGFGEREQRLADLPEFAELLSKKKRADSEPPKPTGAEIDRQYPTYTYEELQGTCGDSRREWVIENLLRRGEVMNLIAAPKVGKSWLVYNMALAVASGNDFLGYKAAKPLNVLIVDNELHQEELAWRVGQVGRAMGATPDGRLNFTFLRGSSVDVDGLDAKLDECGGSRYDIIVIDAFYRILPKGVSENDNSGITQIFNKLDGLARKNEASIINIHHSSKGNQGDKGVTDVGAGAGSISRAADTHMVIREHVDEGLHVIEAVTRSGISPKPVTAKLEWPLWKEVKGVEPTLKTFENARKKLNDEQKKENCGREDVVVNYMLDWQEKNDSKALNSAQLHQALKMSTWGNEKTFKKHLKSMVEKGRLKELPKEAGSLALRYFAL